MENYAGWYLAAVVKSNYLTAVQLFPLKSVTKK